MMSNKESINLYDRIAIILIILLMSMELSLTKIFAGFIAIFNYSYNPPALCILYVLIILAVYLLVFIPRFLGASADNKSAYNPSARNDSSSSYYNDNAFLCALLLLMLLAIISVDIITLANGQLRISNIFTHNLDYFYVFLSLPMLVLIKEDKWKIGDFINAILLISALSMLLRIFVSLYYGYTGVEFTAITRESAFEGWIRNGTLRIVPPCFIMILCPLSIYMFIKTKSIALKHMYILECILTIYYVYFIWQSRIACVFIAIGIAIMILFRIRPLKWILVEWGIVLTGVVVALFMGGLSKIASLFSVSSNAVYAGENRGHYYAYDVFFAQFLQKPYGAGLSENLAELIGGDKYIWLCDAGIMYSLLPMGILIAVFFFLMFSRGIYVYLSGYRKNDFAVLSFAMTVSLLVCEVSMDCFFTPTAFMVPFLLTLIEYGASE